MIGVYEELSLDYGALLVTILTSGICLEAVNGPRTLPLRYMATWAIATTSE